MALGPENGWVCSSHFDGANLCCGCTFYIVGCHFVQLAGPAYGTKTLYASG